MTLWEMRRLFCARAVKLRLSHGALYAEVVIAAAECSSSRINHVDYAHGCVKCNKAPS
jgi:hypothetical protein